MSSEQTKDVRKVWKGLTLRWCLWGLGLARTGFLRSRGKGRHDEFNEVYMT